MDIALKYPALRAQAHKAAMCAGCTGVERAGQLAVAAVEKALHAADSPDDWAMEGGLWLVGNDGSVEQRWFAREFQFVQWTMGAAPGHPILRGVCPRPPGAVKRP